MKTDWLTEARYGLSRFSVKGREGVWGVMGSRDGHQAGQGTVQTVEAPAWLEPAGSARKRQFPAMRRVKSCFVLV